MIIQAQGLPNMVSASYGQQTRTVIYDNFEKVETSSIPFIIDGLLSSNPAAQQVSSGNVNGYSAYLWAGMFLGRETTGGLWRTSIIDTVQANASASATSFTVTSAGAIEINRLIAINGGAITLTGTGPTTTSTSATLAASITGVTGAVVSTGVVTCSALANALYAGSLIGPADGSQIMQTVILDPDGILCCDGTFTNRLNAYCTKPWIGGGTANTALLVNYPQASALPTLSAYIQDQLRAGICPAANFLDDIISAPLA